ncbi:MAG TPA: biotin--[acetyl-CoA-carboxylase] ligase [Flavisolibacter sp.]
MPNPVGTPFIELQTVDSTNNYAMGLVHEGMAQHGTVVFTHEQTRGRGQRNRPWLSARDQNITMSVVLEPQGLASSQLFSLSMAVAIAAARFFNKYTAGNVTIKWPNDIFWRDRKAGGILIENVLLGNDWKFAVAGIGLNINQTNFGELGTKAVSLKQITGTDFDPVQLARELCSVVEEAFNHLLRAPGEIPAEYHEMLYKRDEQVRLKKGSRVFDATISHVTPAGQLVVQHSTEERFEVGEVEWVI